MGTGSKVLNATDCKDFLGTKFAEKTNPNFFLKLIDVDDLAGSQAEARSKNTRRLKVQTAFKSLIFNHFSQLLKLCLTYVSVTIA